ncbi:hypothetical protein HanPSC8_Chr03g0133231 [Helianthus annuus]|nr:hypothetical protein HanPSC8_Chr03g0133231 [Helianthus annuus]
MIQNLIVIVKRYWALFRRRSRRSLLPVYLPLVCNRRCFRFSLNYMVFLKKKILWVEIL